MSKELKEAIRAAIGDGIKNVVIDSVMSDEAVWDEIDKIVQRELEENKQCWLSFHGAKAMGLVALGHGDVAVELPVEAAVEAYDSFGPGCPGDGQIDDVREQIAGIDAFTNELKAKRAQLQASLDRVGAKVH